jgi:predicted SAM-dependent methyltransferase
MTKLATAVKPLIRYDLGAGKNKQEGFRGVDIMPGSDIVADLNKPWKFAKDGTVDELYSSHTIEHVDDLIHFFNEAHRILKPEGRLTIIAPYYSSVRCWQDPTHKHAISEHSLLYYNKAWRDQNGLDHYPITADFDFSFGYAFYPEWQNRSEEARAFAIKYYINVVSDLQATLTKRTG